MKALVGICTITSLLAGLNLTAAPFKGDSLFNSSTKWKDQDGRQVSLSAFSGKPTIITMFYSTCRTSCPITMSKLQQLSRLLPPEKRTQTRFVLVTFDSLETSIKLQKVASTHHLPLDNWSLLHGSEADVRELAALLDIKYRRQGGEFIHSSALIVLDSDGRAINRLDDLEQGNLEPLVASLIALPQKKP